MAGAVRNTTAGVTIGVRVTPRSGRSGIAGWRDDELVVHLNAPPVEGAANAELVEVIAAALGVPKRAVSIGLGHRSRHKTVRVTGVSVEEVRSRL